MSLGELALALSQGSGIPLVSAFLIGIVVSISPCPLATNVTAMSYISRRAVDRKYAVMAATLYTLGRMFSYSVIGILIIVIGLGVSGISSFLQDIGEQWLGPLLVLVGLLLLVADKLSFWKGSDRIQSLGGKVVDWGIIGGFFLGALFALAFCPFSAIMFFGVLIPLALKVTAGTLLPPVFAIGTGLPVLILGILLSFGVSRVSSWVNAINRIQPILRIAVSVIFIGVGIYYIVLCLQSTGD
ncbi:aromatic aminobenezylarsenical efflux permease ArsG family transporter [Chloroflexota bacterium]